MNKNDKTMLLAKKKIYGITCTCFLAFVNVTCVTIIISKFLNGMKVLGNVVTQTQNGCLQFLIILIY